VNVFLPTTGSLCYVFPMDGIPPRAFDPRAATMTSRRNMPHWRQSQALYFVTFRLADSLPLERLEELRRDREDQKRFFTEDATVQDIWERERCIDEWLHAGHGSCCLKNADAGEIVENALRFFDGDRYRLGPFVVMPNHVHGLVMPLPGHDLSKILHSWKSFTSNAVNRVLKRTGQLWQDESFDHIVRSQEHAEKFKYYIRENPASLPAGTYRLGNGSLEI
jgi:REP element-mobilizing transposase RayT